jgi:sortase (surface protein transpeptidase)
MVWVAKGASARVDRRPARRAALVTLILAGTAVLSGGFEVAGVTWPQAPPRAVAGAGPGTPALSGSGGTATGSDVAATAPVTDPPARVRIPAIRVDTPLETLGLDNGGALQAPTDFSVAGWYAEGTVPGDVGPAVIAGHVDSRAGPAVFFRLYQLRPGNLVQVARADRWVTFRVVRTVRYAKNRFPTAEVYGPTPDPQLRLITCGGSFDAARRSYVDNVVVYAVAE